MFAGENTIAGRLHNCDAWQHGYNTYIKAYKCDDKQGEIARLTVRAEAAEGKAKALREALELIIKRAIDEYAKYSGLPREEYEENAIWGPGTLVGIARAALASAAEGTK